MLINGSSPTTHASCPTSPGPNSASDPSSIRTTIRPERTWMRWPTWQLSVPTIGLRPAPSRLMGHAPDLDTPQVHDLYLALVKGSYFFRGHQSSFSPSLPRRTSNPITSDLAPSSCRNTSSSVLHPSTAHGSAHLSSTLSNLKKKSVDFF